MDGVGMPQFHGTDANECEEFIAGVIKHAYNQGKLRDDEWIADFAVTCLAHDALRWWIGLDEETQKSWKLLQKAMVSRYQPLFYGRDGKEAEQFVHSVRQRARDAGKQEDNDWIITFVSDCFVGNALRWYEALDSRIQKDWKLLRAAILARYPCDSQSAQPSRADETPADRPSRIPNNDHYSIPTPASAASPPPKSKTRGRIKVMKKNRFNFEYLSKRPGGLGLALSSARTDALEVEYDPTSSTPHTLFIPDVQISVFDTLGAQWNPTNVFAYICGINLTSGDTTFHGTWRGLKTTDIWSIPSSPPDTTQLLPMKATNGNVPLFARTRSSDSEFIWLTIEPKTLSSEVDVDLFFEPM